VPVIQAESGPIRVKPTNPGGLQVAGASNDIFSDGGDTADAKLAPPPQTPDPQALRAMEAPKPAPTPAAPQAATTAALPAAPASAVPPANPHPVAPVTREAESSPAPAVRPASAANPAPVGVAAVHAPAPAATGAHPAGPAKDVEVQLAALSSEQAAHEEWVRLMQRWPDLLRGHRPAFSRFERDGHVFWRVRASGFDGLPDATTFCEHVRAKGGGCSVADF